MLLLENDYYKTRVDDIDIYDTYVSNKSVVDQLMDIPNKDKQIPLLSNKLLVEKFVHSLFEHL